jgi:hypothetical protein
MNTRYRLLLAWLAIAALTALGCGGPDFQAICEELEECAEGNEKDVEACVIGFEASADAADEIGCGDEFDAYYECVGEEISCDFNEENDACEVEGNALGRCF